MTRTRGPYSALDPEGRSPGALSQDGNGELIKIDGPFRKIDRHYLNPPTDVEVSCMDADERDLPIHQIGSHECWYVKVYLDGRRFLFRSQDADRAMLYAARWIVQERGSR